MRGYANITKTMNKQNIQQQKKIQVILNSTRYSEGRQYENVNIYFIRFYECISSVGKYVSIFVYIKIFKM